MTTNIHQPVKKVALHTLGCRLNSSETGSIAHGFIERGFEIVEFGEPADVTFINTCTVTDGADQTCRQMIRKARSVSPQGKVVIAGCYAQMEAEKIKQMESVDLILGNQEKYRVFDFLGEENSSTHIDKNWTFQGAATTLADSHTRAFLKIQDGCNYVCSFCIIPFARGRSRAISVQAATLQAQKLIDDGFKEIVLTGVNIGEYESASGEKLEDLVQSIVNLKGLQRLRLSSVEPNTITEKLLSVLKASQKYQDHFHIPLQSGSNQILSSMRRKYDVAFYRDTINQVKSFFPQASIGADVIVGYPGESEENFNETFNLLRELPITHFHIFPFSKRKNTSAAKMNDQVPKMIKKQRVKILMGLGQAKLNEYAQQFIGSVQPVLFEKNHQGFSAGYTPHFIKVEIPTFEDWANEIKMVKLTSFNGSFYRGMIQS